MNFFGKSLIIGFFVVSINWAVQTKAEDQKQVINAIYAESNKITKKYTMIPSHYPVPFIYADWQAEVIKNFSAGSIAKNNMHLYEDLPPCKDIQEEQIPVNSVLKERLIRDKENAIGLIIAALKAKPDEAQWSVIEAANCIKSDKFLESFASIALYDPDATDRAFAFKAIARIRHPQSTQILREGLFDDHFSVRLLCMELLGELSDHTGAVNIVLSLKPLNPFHQLFMLQAFKRLWPLENHQEFFKSSVPDRIAKLTALDPGVLQNYLTLAARKSTSVSVAIALYRLGDPDQAKEALGLIEKVLLKQGQQEDKYHSPAFWQRAEIIQVLQTSDSSQVPLLAELMIRNISSYSKDREMLLLALAYAFSGCIYPRVEDSLTKYRDLKTDNYDLYLAGALGLANQHSLEVFPSLLHVLSQKKQPFFDMANKTLEDLTGEITPDKPKAPVVLTNLGLPKEEINMNKAIKFWEEWLKTNHKNLKYDYIDKRFQKIKN